MPTRTNRTVRIEASPITSPPEPDVADEEGPWTHDDPTVEGLFDSVEGEAETIGSPDEVPPQPRAPGRSPATDIIQMGWYGAGKALVKTNVSPAAGRTMGLQSRLAGEQIDRYIAGTIIDRMLLQPLVRAQDATEGIGAVVAAPLLAAIMERKPEMAPLVMDTFVDYVLDGVVAMADQAKEKKQEQAAKARSLEEIGDMFGLPDDASDEDRLAALNHYVFGGMEDATESAPTE